MIPGFIVRWLTPAPDSGIADDIRRGKSPWADSIHLLWSMWLFITPFFDKGFDGYTRTWLVFTLATYPVFLLLFVKLQLAPRREGPYYALAMIALSLIGMRWYPSGLTYLVFGCVTLRCCSTRFHVYLQQLALVNALYIALAWWIGYPWQLLISMPVVIFIVCTIVSVEEMSQEKDAALRLSQEEVRRLAATAERERIGRDLHDLLGHTLSLITLKLELSRRLFDRDVEAARHEVEEAEKVARQALAEVRSAVTGIRATDIAAELAAARMMLESASVHLDYGAVPPLPVETERALALVLREAVTNISRHAGAGMAQILFEPAPPGLLLRIADDGRGGVSADGNGLSGMRERVRALGGSMEVESPRGQGTTLLIRLPPAATRCKDIAGTGTAPTFAEPRIEELSKAGLRDLPHDGLVGGHA